MEGCPVEGGAVDSLYPAHQGIVAELVPRTPAARLPQAAGAGRVSQQRPERLCERVRVVRRYKETLFAVPDLVGDAPNGARDHRDAGGHRLEDDERRSFGQRGDDEHVQEPYERPRVRPVTEKADALPQS